MLPSFFPKGSLAGAVQPRNLRLQYPKTLSVNVSFLLSTYLIVTFPSECALQETRHFLANQLQPPISPSPTAICQAELFAPPPSYAGN